MCGAFFRVGSVSAFVSFRAEEEYVDLFVSPEVVEAVFVVDAVEGAGERLAWTFSYR